MTESSAPKIAKSISRQIRTVAVLTALSVAVVLYLAFLNTRAFRETIVSQTQQHLLTIAKGEAKRLQNTFQRIQTELELLSNVKSLMSLVRSDDPGKRTAGWSFDINRYLPEHLGELVSAVYWVDATGKVLNVFPREAKPGGPVFFDDLDFRFVMENRKPIIDEWLDAESGLRAVCVSVPFVEEETVIGVLRAFVSLDKLNDSIQSVQVGAKGHIRLVDDSGIVLSHPDAEQVGEDMMAVRKERFPGHDWSHVESIVAKMKTGEEGADVYLSARWNGEKSETVRKITAFAPVRLAEELWSVGAVIGYEEVAGPVGKHARNTYLGATVFILMFLAGGVYLYQALRKRDELALAARSAETLRAANLSLCGEIAEREKAQKELITFKTMSDNAGYGTALADMEYRFVYVNEAWAKMHGCSVEELIGATVSVVHTEEQMRQVQLFIEEVKEKGGISPTEIWHKRKDGSTFPTLMSGTTIYGDDGKPLYGAASAIDITERKGLLEQLIRTERLAALGQLAASVAHEVNSPLQAINCILGGMKRFGGTPEEMASNTALIQTALKDIGRTVNNLLDLNRPSQTSRRPVDVNSIVENSVALSRSYLMRNRIEIQTRLAPQMPDIIASPQELNQVLLNLLNNAIEAIKEADDRKKDPETENGSVGKITVETESGNKTVTVTVSDTGPGIPEDKLDRVFDPFFTKKRNYGMGVGLTVCQNIIENHQGAIEARRPDGGGAAFVITLPVE